MTYRFGLFLLPVERDCATPADEDSSLMGRLDLLVPVGQL